MTYSPYFSLAGQTKFHMSRAGGPSTEFLLDSVKVTPTRGCGNLSLSKTFEGVGMDLTGKAIQCPIEVSSVRATTPPEDDVQRKGGTSKNCYLPDEIMRYLDSRLRKLHSVCG